jgi:hypothetical protein
MLESEVDSLWKVNEFYSLRIIDSLISTYIIVGFHNCIDYVVIGTKNRMRIR